MRICFFEAERPLPRLSWCLRTMMIAIFCCTTITEVLGQVVDDWRFELRRPPATWMESNFDDSGWRKGSGGFGTYDTPGARVGTQWQSNNIWLRKEFSLESVPQHPGLLIHHDEDVKVFVNGILAFQADGWTTEYKTVPLTDEGQAALVAGKNLLAVHCRQSGGGQFIDVHLIDLNDVPELPPVKRDTTPFETELITQWGEQLTAENAWREYPRPQLVRQQWQNLNGHWDYAISPRTEQSVPTDWVGKILVPFSLESKLSGVGRLLDSTEALWYHRSFELAVEPGRRQLLNFEAVDYRCKVWVNGTEVGEHVGGNDPFAFDITQAARDGQNELVVRVEDDTEAWQLRGKQVLNARGIWYTQVSGIWQTVWLESVPEKYIEDLHIQTDVSEGLIAISTDFGGEGQAGKIRVRVRDGELVVADESSLNGAVTLKVQDAKLWSPTTPHLYGIDVELLNDDGSIADSLESYAGIRSVGKVRDDSGHWRFTLNGEVLFHWGPLDQGWWPDGLLTPPSDEAMLSDLEFLKSAGFNMIRKHIKVEPRRYYYHCDRLGMLVWQDQVSGGKNPPWTRLQPNPVDATWPDEYHEQFMLEFERMIDALENHPSIVVWTPFNEAWGQHRTIEVGEWTVERDPSRLVNIASGGNFWAAGDIVDAHSYPDPEFPFAPERDAQYIMVMGEFGGHGLPVQGHLWDANRRNWGYGTLPKDREEYRQRYVTSLNKLNELRRRGIAAGVYTQTTDVEGEINGLMTYDRKVIKIPAEELSELHRRLFEPMQEPK